MKNLFFIPCLFAFLHHYKQMYKQKHTMARKLNRVLPSSNLCVITQREKGSCTETLLCTTWAKHEKTAKLVLLVSKDVRETQTETSSIQRSVLWRKRFWQVSVHRWHVWLLIWCASVLCVAWKRSSFLSLAASFLSLFFLPSPLHLHNPWRGFGQSAWKRYFLELTFFLKLKFFWHERHCV